MITSRLSCLNPKKKHLLRRTEPHLLMCGVPLMTNTAVQKWLASRDEARPSLASLKEKPGQAVVFSAGIQMSKRKKVSLSCEVWVAYSDNTMFSLYILVILI